MSFCPGSDQISHSQIVRTEQQQAPAQPQLLLPSLSLTVLAPALSKLHTCPGSGTISLPIYEAVSACPKIISFPTCKALSPCPRISSCPWHQAQLRQHEAGTGRGQETSVRRQELDAAILLFQTTTIAAGRRVASTVVVSLVKTLWFSETLSRL